MPALPNVPEPGTISFKGRERSVRPEQLDLPTEGPRLGNKVKGAPVMLLDHVGRKSGTARTAPVLYLEDGADLVIVASRGGSDTMPG